MKGRKEMLTGEVSNGVVCSRGGSVERLVGIMVMVKDCGKGKIMEQREMKSKR